LRNFLSKPISILTELCLVETRFIKRISPLRRTLAFILILSLLWIIFSYLVKSYLGLAGGIFILGLTHIVMLIEIMMRSWCSVSKEKSHRSRWDLLVLTGIDSKTFLYSKTVPIIRHFQLALLLIASTRLGGFIILNDFCLKNPDSCGIQPVTVPSLIFNSAFTGFLIMIWSIVQLRQVVMCGAFAASIARQRPAPFRLIFVAWIMPITLVFIVLLFGLLPFAKPPSLFYEPSPLYERAIFVQGVIMVTGIALFDYGLISSYIMWYSGVLQSNSLFNPALFSLILVVVLHILLTKIITLVSLRTTQMQGLL